MKHAGSFLSLAALFCFVFIVCPVASGGEKEKKFEIAVTKGSFAIENESYAEAVGYLEEALRLKPKSSDANLLLGIAFSRSKKYPEAKKVLLEAVRQGGETDRVKYELGIALYHLDAWEEARELFAEVANSGGAEDELKASSGKYLAMTTPSDDARAAGEKNYSISAITGLQYDSNVILESENPTGNDTDEADWRWLLSLNGKWDFYKIKPVAVSLGYMFYQSLHFDLDEFNVHQHNLILSGEYEISEPFKTGLEYMFTYTAVGGDHYSNIHSIRPYAVWRQGQRFEAELHYSHEIEDFDDSDHFTDNSQRTGANDAIGITGKLKLDQASGVMLNYTFNSNAVDSDTARHWQYDGHRLSVDYSRIFGKKWEGSIGASYQKREYDATFSSEPAGSANREEEETNYSCIVVWKPSSKWFVSLTENYTINDSNVSKTDYKRNIVGLVAGVNL